ncbi:ABC transporter permease [Candidatus Aerophobetes bacterium]|nr:ABC transporter permease [Candidatus Aerophobetes bacterium]
MRQSFILAQKSFRKSLRDKIFIIFFIFASILIFLSFLLSSLTFTARLKMIKDVGLFGISVFSSFIAIFLSAEAVVGEVEKKTIYILLSKPPGRKNFLLGSFLGIALTAGTSILINGCILFFLIFTKQNIIDYEILIALFFMELEVLVLTSIGIMFSSFSSSVMTSTFLSLLFYILGHLNPQFESLKKITQSTILKELLTFLQWILPNLELFKIPESLNMFYAALAALYSVFYSGIYLIIACIIFERRQL